MVKLIDIVKEVKQGSELDLSDLKKLPDLIGIELEKASKQENESIIGGFALTLAAPGIIKNITKIVQIIAKKAGLDLRKRETPEWYNTLNAVTSKIDDYLDTPFRVMLRLFIQDEVKRNRAAKFLKGVTLAAMAIIGALDLNALQDLDTVIGDLVGSAKEEVLQAITQHSLPKLTQVVKDFLVTLK